MKKIIVLLPLLFLGSFLFAQSQQELLLKYQQQMANPLNQPSTMRDYQQLTNYNQDVTQDTQEKINPITLKTPYYMEPPDSSTDVKQKPNPLLPIEVQQLFKKFYPPVYEKDAVFGYNFFAAARARIMNLEQKLIMGMKTMPTMEEITVNSTFVGPLEMLSSSIYSYVPQRYYIKPLDKLQVSYWGITAPQINMAIQVDKNGNIDIPNIGNKNVSGLTLDSFQKNLNHWLQTKYGKASDSVVSLAQNSSIQVTITGEIFRPGTYLVNNASSVFNALFVCGGINKTGSFRNIRIIRDQKEIAIDFYDFLLRGKGAGDLPLQPGDVLYIPPIANIVKVSGPLNRTGLFEMKTLETIEDLLDITGGLKPKGTYERVVIKTTKEHEQREIIVVNLKKYPAKIKTPLSDGDEVNFFLIEDEFVNQISLQGAVKYPGNYEFKEGMRILDLFDGPNKINEDTYLGHADVYSFKDNFRDVSLKTIDLGKAFKKDPQHNIKLKNLDKIIIYSKWDINYFREPVVHLFGAVQYPGFFPRSKGLTLSSLIRQAGGLLPQSHSLINVIRANGDQEVLTFNLDFNKFKLGGEKDILLEDGDIIAVKTNQPYRMDPETVTIEGEVKYPGVYPIKPGIERLEDLLKVAGGVLDSGWLPGITVMRKANEQITEKQKTNINAINAIVKYINQIKFEQTKRRHEYLLGKEGLGPDAGSAANTLNPTSRESALKGSLGITIAGSSQEVVGGAFDVGRETGSILTEARELSERDFITNEYVVLNFSGTELSSENNIVLQDKDVFSIPPKINTVEIVGAVYRPTRVFFHKNYDLEDYIDFVGGFTEDANSEKVIILRLNGAIIPADSIDQFNPGDVIFVPTKVISTEIKTSLDKILDVIRFTLVTLTSYWVLITLLAL